MVPGTRVAKGQIVGYVGNSGTSNGALGTELDSHLHFELRYGVYPAYYTGLPKAMPEDTFLGQGISFKETREALKILFATPTDGR